MPKTLTCGHCGGRITGDWAWSERNSPHPTGLCQRCFADSFGCPRCGRRLPKSENRGSMCRVCRSEYNRAYAARRRGADSPTAATGRRGSEPRGNPHDEHVTDRGRG
jgi:NMD protein affecting ribosome stability and mRNA decay